MAALVSTKSASSVSLNAACAYQDASRYAIAVNSAASDRRGPREIGQHGARGERHQHEMTISSAMKPASIPLPEPLASAATSPWGPSG